VANFHEHAAKTALAFSLEGPARNLPKICILLFGQKDFQIVQVVLASSRHANWRAGGDNVCQICRT
jgi:hypothetical protein